MPKNFDGAWVLHRPSCLSRHVAALQLDALVCIF